MRATIEIARVNLLRTLRERTNFFFIFLLPLIIIIALGAAFGGAGVSRLGVVRSDAGPLGDELVAIIEAGEIAVEVRERDSLEGLQSGVEDGDLEFGLLIPPGYDQSIRAGEPVELGCEEYFAGEGLSVVEWADRAEGLIPADSIKVEFTTIDENTRRIQVTFPENRITEKP